LPLNTAALDTFIAIEKPEFPPVALLAARIFPTIGDFYDAISKAFQSLQPPIAPIHQVANSRTGAFLITSVADALKAVNQIKEQGGGRERSRFGGDLDFNDLAHYYRFKEIREGHKLQKEPDGTYHTLTRSQRLCGLRPQSPPCAVRRCFAHCRRHSPHFHRRWM